MSHDENSAGAFAEHLAHLSESPVEGAGEHAGGINEFSTAVELLGELSQAGLEDIDENLKEAVDRLSVLAESVECSLSDFNDDDPDVTELVEFVIESCNSVREVAFGDECGEIDTEHLACLKEAIEVRLESREESATFDDHDDEPKSDPDVVAPSREEIAAMLSGLSAQTQAEISPQPRTPLQSQPQSESTNDQKQTEPTEDRTRTDAAATQQIDAGGPTVGSSNIAVPKPDDVDVDEELREAFMDDATRGLETMEQALLDLESNPTDPTPVKLIGRELHTIKGASGSIGLANLSSYIHEVEELIRETQSAEQTVTAELLLPHVDLIRARVDGKDFAEPEVIETPKSTDNVPVPTLQSASQPISNSKPTVSLSDSHGDDETVRVKASQLNRLMDMLSELVMLRNQRDTEISELKGIHDELIYSVTRIRMLSHEGEALLAGDNFTNPELAEEGVSFSHLNEVANDVLESAQRLRECYRPVADGNQAVSQFIRNFRLELVQLRRMPVSGLFRRLHRAISDAARAEQKQVRVELVGENTGIERSLQERIFEPLLHIVRNSVSHGIETPEDRIASGKPTQGVVKLHAHSGPDLLVIEVTDDGRGLDYDAIRRRGIERGLIDAEKSISHAELARLIFHPGFSTRQSANQISGRGVGMDVVATTLERMRGWVEVESEHGNGSTIRLSLPLPSMIQHAMVFRSGGQLYALPAQAVRRTGDFDGTHSPVDLNRVLGIGDEAEGATHQDRVSFQRGFGSHRLPVTCIDRRK